MGAQYPMFSLIILAYNAEEYINRSISSCLHQDYHNIEIIVVDDGSCDQTRAIIEDYCKQDTRVRLVSNAKNCGILYSRIKGIQESVGKYLLFLDSDDEIEQNTCSTLKNIIQSSSDCYDIIAFQSIRIVEGYTKKMECCREGEYFNEEILPVLTDKAWSLWGKAYDRRLLSKTLDIFSFLNLNIPKINMAEDLILVFLISLFAKRMKVIEQAFYCYHYVETSVTHQCETLFQIQQNIRAYNYALLMLDRYDNIVHRHQYYHIVKEKIKNRLKKYKVNWLVKKVRKLKKEKKPFSYLRHYLRILNHQWKLRYCSRLLLFLISLTLIKA